MERESVKLNVTMVHFSRERGMSALWLKSPRTLVSSPFEVTMLLANVKPLPGAGCFRFCISSGTGEFG